MYAQNDKCSCGSPKDQETNELNGSCPYCGAVIETTSIAGIHEAHGIGEVTGLDIQAPARIEPGTVVRVSGVGKITGTLIGRRPK